MALRNDSSLYPVCVFPETEIVEAARLMRDKGLTALLVGDGERILGLVTDRDIVVRGVAADDRPRLVGSVMTPLPSLPLDSASHPGLRLVHSPAETDTAGRPA